MSRNFELLQKVGQEHGIAVATARAPMAVEPRIPTLATTVAAREEINKLVQRVFLIDPAEAARIVVFCGVNSGSGCSTVVARVAETLAAKVPGAVCVIDANLRNPGLHRQFNIDNEVGFADVLKTTESPHTLSQQLGSSNLWLLPAGKIDSDRFVINSDRMKQCISQLRNYFEYLVIDTAAMNTCNDVMSFTQAVDGCVLVVRAESTRRETAKRAKQELQDADIRILGAVLNDRTFPIPEKLYNRL